MAVQHGGEDAAVRLRELFPAMDADVCGVILHENNGNVEGAINQLLQLTDPSYRPDEQPAPRSLLGTDHSSETAAQVLQDEEYAARLQQEEENELQRATEERRTSNYVYQQQQQQPEIPLVDQLTALADSAKSKLSSIVDRFKAKPAGDKSRPTSAEARSPHYTALPEDEDGVFVVGNAESGNLRADDANEDDAPLERRQHARNQQQSQQR